METIEGERLKVSWQRDKVLRVTHKDLFVAAGGKFGEKSFVVLTSESLNILCPSLVTLFSRYNTPSNTLEFNSHFSGRNLGQTSAIKQFCDFLPKLVFSSRVGGIDVVCLLLSFWVGLLAWRQKWWYRSYIHTIEMFWRSRTIRLVMLQFTGLMS